MASMADVLSKTSFLSSQPFTKSPNSNFPLTASVSFPSKSRRRGGAVLRAGLIALDGGEMVEPVVAEPRRREKKHEAAELPRVELTPIDLQWMHVLSEGWASPLGGFMRESEFLQTLHFNSLRLDDGSVINMSVPIVLAIDDEQKARIGESKRVALIDSDGNPVAILSDSVNKRLWKFVDVVCYIRQTIVEVFGNNGLRDNGGKHGRERLGEAGLSLHYANIIQQIDSIASRPSSLPSNVRDTLYNALPTTVKTALRPRLQTLDPEEELSISEIKAEMEKSLQWLVPFATNTTKAHQGFGWVGEWANSRQVSLTTVILNLKFDMGNTVEKQDRVWEGKRQEQQESKHVFRRFITRINKMLIHMYSSYGFID